MVFLQEAEIGRQRPLRALVRADPPAEAPLRPAADPAHNRTAGYRHSGVGRAPRPAEEGHPHTPSVPPPAPAPRSPPARTWGAAAHRRGGPRPGPTTPAPPPCLPPARARPPPRGRLGERPPRDEGSGCPPPWRERRGGATGGGTAPAGGRGCAKVTPRRRVRVSPPRDSVITPTRTLPPGLNTHRHGRARPPQGAGGAERGTRGISATFIAGGHREKTIQKWDTDREDSEPRPKNPLFHPFPLSTKLVAAHVALAEHTWNRWGGKKGGVDIALFSHHSKHQRRE